MVDILFTESDPDLGSKNVAVATDPDPKHWMRWITSSFTMRLTCLKGSTRWARGILKQEQKYILIKLIDGLLILTFEMLVNFKQLFNICDIWKLKKINSIFSENVDMGINTYVLNP